MYDVAEIVLVVSPLLRIRGWISSQFRRFSQGSLLCSIHTNGTPTYPTDTFLLPDAGFARRLSHLFLALAGRFLALRHKTGKASGS